MGWWSEPAWIALALSLKVACWATAIDVVIGVALGYLLARGRFPGRELLDAVLTLPMVSLPLILKSARTAFETVDLQFEQAARVLGIASIGVFLRVTLPLAWRGVLAGALLAFARAMGEFGATLMVAGSIPGKTQTLSIAVYEAVQAGQDDSANLLVLITSLTCVTVLIVANKLTPNRHQQP